MKFESKVVIDGRRQRIGEAGGFCGRGSQGCYRGLFGPGTSSFR